MVYSLRLGRIVGREDLDFLAADDLERLIAVAALGDRLDSEVDPEVLLKGRHDDVLGREWLPLGLRLVQLEGIPGIFWFAHLKMTL